MTIHRKDCPNIYALKDARHVPLRWKERKEKDTVRLRVTVEDKPGILAEILNIIAQKGINVHSVYTHSKKQRVVISIVLDAASQQPEHIDRVGELMLQMRSLKEVVDVRKLSG